MDAWPKQIDGPVAVIGDVHGRFDLLEPLLLELDSRPDRDRRTIVFVGDYVDRGRFSREVIDSILELKSRRPVAAIVGNHDLAMAVAVGAATSGDADADARWAEQWVLFYDSEATFESYGANVGDLEQLKSNVPEEHASFLANAPWLVTHPDYVFVHAGLDAERPFDDQIACLEARVWDEEHPSWLCSKSFYQQEYPEAWPRCVVMGHAPTSMVRFETNRIRVDTCGGREGQLSCVLLPEREVLQSGGRQTQTPRPPKKRGWLW